MPSSIFLPQRYTHARQISGAQARENSASRDVFFSSPAEVLSLLRKKSKEERERETPRKAVSFAQREITKARTHVARPRLRKGRKGRRLGEKETRAGLSVRIDNNASAKVPRYRYI